MSFEIFARRRRRNIGLSVHIYPKGMALSRNCLTFIGQKKVLLLYDPEKDFVGIRRAQEGDRYAYTISENKGSGMINAVSFMRHIGNPESRRYEATTDDAANLLQISLGRKAA